jgi:molybdopterin converting factor small subunit
MKSIQVRVQLFGAFRKYSSGSDLRFEVPPGTTFSAVRGHLGAALRSAFPAFVEQALLDVSVLADADRVLDEDQLLGAGLDVVTLAVLPPVCGG